MRVHKLIPNIAVPDVEIAREFYTDFLGLTDEEFNLGWVARLSTPDHTASVQLVSGDRTAPVDSSLSATTDDVDTAYAEAIAGGYEIVHPLTTEQWGPRRFFVRAPDGTVINVVGHPPRPAAEH